MENFMKLTNFDALAPRLRAAQLLTDDEFQKLVGPTGGIKLPPERSKYFYVEVIGSKGAKAYTILRACLEQALDHKGHEDLVALFDQVVLVECTESASY